MPYDVRDFFKFNGLYPGNITYAVPELHQLWVFCRGNPAQMKRMMEPTPFDLQSDIFVIGVGDFSKGTGWADACLLMPVLFDGSPGGNYYFEYEDQHASVASGREVWGYPKALAKIDWQEDDAGARIRVYDYETEVFSVAVTYDGTVDASRWNHVVMYPQYQVRAVPEIAGAGFSLFDVVARDPSRDYTHRRTLLGRASVQIGKMDLANGILGDKKLEICDVLGAEMRIGDYQSTAQNGVPKIVRSFV